MMMTKYRGEIHWLPEGEVHWRWPDGLSAESLAFIEEHFAQWLRIRRRELEAHESLTLSLASAAQEDRT